MIPKPFLYLLFALFPVLQIGAQDSLPKFSAPLDIPLYLSGNFAELRSNHFHTGIDIRTSGVEGLKVRAAAEGVISRISVSPYGYGNAIYISHPNGYTTVYGHLQSFSDKIEAAVRAEQYAKESFSVDFTPKEEIVISDRELIALSGNSGGSGGAHLHFEIRDTKTERPQNPLLFGFDIEDRLPPRIRGVRFHPLSDSTLINGVNEAKSFVVRGEAGDYRLKEGQNIEVYGAFGVSVHGLDFLNGAPNKCGLFSVDLKIDGEGVCAQEFRELDFATTRHINCYKDYEAYRISRWHYHKSFIEPGNDLEIYTFKNSEDGLVYFNETAEHQVIYTVRDAYGNSSVLDFVFKSLARNDGPPAKLENYDAYFTYNSGNHFEYGEEISIEIPEGALYKDLKFRFGREIKTSKTISARYSIHNEHVPLQEPIEVFIKTPPIPEALKSKIVVQKEDPGGYTRFLTGSIEGANYKFKSKDFGRFALALDTIKPELSLSKWSSSGVLDSKSILNFIGKDEMSGIKNYRATVNGEWVVLNYDAKNNRFWVRPGDSNFKSGSNALVIRIEDYCGNIAELNLNYEYR